MLKKTQGLKYYIFFDFYKITGTFLKVKSEQNCIIFYFN